MQLRWFWDQSPMCDCSWNELQTNVLYWMWILILLFINCYVPMVKWTHTNRVYTQLCTTHWYDICNELIRLQNIKKTYTYDHYNHHTVRKTIFFPPHQRIICLPTTGFCCKYFILAVWCFVWMYENNKLRKLILCTKLHRGNSFFIPPYTNNKIHCLYYIYLLRIKQKLLVRSIELSDIFWHRLHCMRNSKINQERIYCEIFVDLQKIPEKKLA